jgi:hypothetical protein
MIVFLKLKYYYTEKYYEKQRNVRNKFELIWSLGTFPNDLFILLFLFSVINLNELGRDPILLLGPLYFFFYFFSQLGSDLFILLFSQLGSKFYLFSRAYSFSSGLLGPLDLL